MDSIRQKLPLHSGVEHRIVQKVKILLPETRDINTKNHKGYTALHLACEHGHQEILDLLCSRKDVDITAKTDKGFTALHILSFRGNTKGIANILRTFRFVDVNATSNKGSTPLIEACKENHVEAAQCLLEQGANVNHHNYEKRYTALIYAARYGYTQCVELLLKYGAHIEAKDGYGFTSLMKAASWNFTEVCEVLLKNGADVNAFAQYQTPVTLCCTYGKLEALRLLISYGADVHFPGPFSSALIECAKKGNVECAKELMKVGVNVGATKNGKSALDFAVENNHPAMVEVISESLFLPTTTH